MWNGINVDAIRVTNIHRFDATLGEGFKQHNLKRLACPSNNTHHGTALEEGLVFSHRMVVVLNLAYLFIFLFVCLRIYI